jgi:hypothetical protein
VSGPASGPVSEAAGRWGGALGALKTAGACAALAFAGRYFGTRAWKLVAGAALFFVVYALIQAIRARR